MKVCTRCKKEKELNQFYNKKRPDPYPDDYSSRCKSCFSELRKHYYTDNKEKILAQHKKSKLKFRHGITEEQYNFILDSQDGKCAFCGRKSCYTTKEARLAVDHEHGSSKIRGLLCYTCNMRLGWFENNKEKILQYIEGEKWPTFQHPDIISRME